MIKQLIYGEPGAGKTCLLGTALDVPEMNPILFADWEGNTDSIESKCRYLGTNKEGIAQLGNPEEGKIDVVRFKCTDRSFLGGGKDLSGIDSFQKIIEYLANEDHPYKTFMIDSLSAFDHWSMNWIMQKFPLKSGRANPDIPEYPDFRKNLMLFTDTFYLLVDLPINVIVTCQTYSDFDKQGQLVGIMPRLTGQARTAVAGIMKQVGLVRASSSGTRTLHFQPFGNYIAPKDCSEGGKFGDNITNPTYAKIWERRFGDK